MVIKQACVCRDILQDNYRYIVTFAVFSTIVNQQNGDILIKIPAFLANIGTFTVMSTVSRDIVMDIDMGY